MDAYKAPQQVSDLVPGDDDAAEHDVRPLHRRLGGRLEVVQHGADEDCRVLLVLPALRLLDGARLLVPEGLDAGHERPVTILLDERDLHGDILRLQRAELPKDDPLRSSSSCLRAGHRPLKVAGRGGVAEAEGLEEFIDVREDGQGHLEDLGGDGRSGGVRALGHLGVPERGGDRGEAVPIERHDG